MNIHTITNNIFNSKTYILSGYKNDAWVIDCGDVKPLITYIAKNNLYLQGILLTHTHFDHIYGLNELTNEFPHVTLYTSETGKNALYNEKENLSLYNGYSWHYRFNNVEVVSESTKIFVCNSLVEIFETPGHDVSSLSYKIENYMFTGDSYIPSTKTFTKWPLSNKPQAIVSEQKILYIVEKNKLIIKAGH